MYSKYLFFLLIWIAIVYTESVSIEEEVKNSTIFTLNWYQASFNGNKNTIVSPISFRILLSLLYQSTIGQSEQELKDHIYFSNKDKTARSQSLTLHKLTSSPNLKVVNRLYVRKGYKLSKSFEDKAINYHSGIEQKDFSLKRETTDEINRFVENQTNGLIKNLIDESVLTDDMVLLLLNTLYFKADWLTKFNNDKVINTPFYTHDGLVKNNNVMRATSSYKLFECSNFSVLEIPYQKNSNAKFWIIKPSLDSNIWKLKDIINYDVLSEINQNLEKKIVYVEIPIFSIENDVSGVSVLKKLGVKSIFNRYEIEALDDTNNKLRVSDARQKTKIIINTAGTEAAAATHISIETRATITNSEKFIVNRPFIYMILIADTNEPIFVGHYAKPN